VQFRIVGRKEALGGYLRARDRVIIVLYKVLIILYEVPDAVSLIVHFPQGKGQSIVKGEDVRQKLFLVIQGDIIYHVSAKGQQAFALLVAVLVIFPYYFLLYPADVERL
jgi:hypothetical protein